MVDDWIRLVGWMGLGRNEMDAELTGGGDGMSKLLKITLEPLLIRKTNLLTLFKLGLTQPQLEQYFLNETMIDQKWMPFFEHKTYTIYLSK